MNNYSNYSTSGHGAEHVAPPPHLHVQGRNVGAVVLLVLVALALVACGKKAGDEPSATKRDLLIAKLREKGEASASTTGWQTAYSAYRFAAYYAPQDEGIKARFAEIKGMTTGLVPNMNETRGLLTVLPQPEDFRNFPVAKPEMEVVNLEMLNDERLVGDLGYTVYEEPTRILAGTLPPSDAGDPNGSQILVFTSTPQYSKLREVMDAYGPPTSSATQAQRTILTYGRFRVIADNTARVRLVIFPLFPE